MVVRDALLERMACARASSAPHGQCQSPGALPHFCKPFFAGGGSLLLLLLLGVRHGSGGGCCGGGGGWVQSVRCRGHVRFNARFLAPQLLRARRRRCSGQTHDGRRLVKSQAPQSARRTPCSAANGHVECQGWPLRSATQGSAMQRVALAPFQLTSNVGPRRALFAMLVCFIYR